MCLITGINLCYIIADMRDAGIVREPCRPQPPPQWRYVVFRTCPGIMAVSSHDWSIFETQG